jgi:predicted MFS family arabinose efflux permease
MAAVKGNRNLVLALMNLGIVLGMALGYRNYQIDKYSLTAVGAVSLLVLNGMFFAVRREPDLPKPKLRRLNRYVVWPIILLAALIVAGEMFCGK